MTLVLPSTVVELNLMQNSMDLPSPTLFTKPSNKGFENIPTEKQLYKREVSLPNGVENWNLCNLDPYLNILDDNLMSEGFKVESMVEDRLVPEEGDQRQRCESYSSVASSMDERHLVYQNFGTIKSFSTVRMDSGSTCISSDHSYVCNDTTSSMFKGLDAEETYQNLDLFLQQGHEMSMTESVPSPLSSSDSCFEVPPLLSNISLHTNENPDVFQDKSAFNPMKRTADTVTEDVCLTAAKAGRYSESPSPRGSESRRRNTSNSKTHCRKTRKEKQKEMDSRVAELESEKEGLLVQLQVLEELIKAHRVKLFTFMERR